MGPPVRLAAVFGLDEQIFYESLACSSPEMVVGHLGALVEIGDMAPQVRSNRDVSVRHVRFDDSNHLLGGARDEV